MAFLPRTPIDGSSFEAEVCICGEARKRCLMTMTMEASALSGEINNSGYQGLTRIPRIYRKSPPKHHFYVRNFFAKTLENVDEWVKSVKSAVRYASLFVWLVVC